MILFFQGRLVSFITRTGVMMKESLIDMKFELQAEIEKAQEELLSLPDVEELQREAQHKRGVHRVTVERSKLPFGKFELNIGEEVKSTGQEAEAAEAVAAEAADVEQKIRKKIDELKGRLEGLQIQAGLKDVVAVQSRMAGIQNLVERIKQTIEKSEQKLAGLDADSHQPMTVLMAQRDAMLADVALGKKVSGKDMLSISEKIAGEEKILADRAALAANIQNEINGLKAKQAELEQELRQADKYHSEMVVAFLGQEMELLAQDYADLARKLFDVFMTIAAMDSIVEGYGSSVKSIPGAAYRFTIPALNFPSCQPPGGGNRSGNLFSFAVDGRNAAKQDVVKGYAEKGLVIQ